MNTEQNIEAILNKYIDEDFINATKTYCKNETKYLFHLPINEVVKEILFTKLIIDNSNHVRIYIEDSLEDNNLFNSYEFLMYVNERLYDPKFHLDIITNIEKIKNENFNALIVLGHHPAYLEGRLNIKDGEGCTLQSDKAITDVLVLGDYSKYRHIFHNDDKFYHLANFGDYELCKKLVINFDDIKNRLENVL